MICFQVVRDVKQSKDGVTVKTEDGCSYKASYVIISVSIGVLLSNLISFTPALPVSVYCLILMLLGLVILIKNMKIL